MKNPSKKMFLSLIMSLLFLTAASPRIEEQIEEFIAYDQRPEKTAYLTFDDGPSIHSEKILSILDEHEVPAIFFVMGASIDNLPEGKGAEILNRMLDEGHHIGYHSMTHNREKLYFRYTSPGLFIQEMEQIRKKVWELTEGYWSNLCRAPYGKWTYFKKEHHVAVSEAGFYCIDWNVDSLDWAKNSTGEIFNQVVSALAEEEYPDQVILLFHERDVTANVLPSIIEYVRSKGYTFIPYIEGEIISELEK